MPEQDTLLPAEENERLEQLAELARLRAEVKELSKARYIRGPEGCTNGDRECDEYDDERDIEWCSHVEHGIATLADVVRADRLEELVNDLRGLAERAPANPLAGQILDTIAHQMEQVELATREAQGG